MASPAAARAAGRSAAQELRGLGINVNLAPVADVGRPGSGLRARDYAGGPDDTVDLEIHQHWLEPA